MVTLGRERLGIEGPAISRMCLGTMTFGGPTDEGEATRIVEGYIAAGGNFIDTADTYEKGASEEIIGRILSRIDTPHDLLLATKVGNPVRRGTGGLSREWILQAVQDSCSRLQRQSLDLYYLHREDETTKLEETVETIGELVADGRVKLWGLSNFRAWRVAEVIRIAEMLRVPRPIVMQPYYHVLNRTAETEVLPVCLHYGLGVVTYSPLGRGILTGKYRGGITPENSRAGRGDKRMLETEFLPETLSAAASFAEYAEKKGRSPSALAIQWVLANRLVSSVLIGPRTKSHLDGYLAAAEAPFDEQDEAALGSLCAPGHTPSPGHSDPRYPIRGRLVASSGRGS